MKRVQLAFLLSFGDEVIERGNVSLLLADFVAKFLDESTDKPHRP
jgi:hypothetical protein